MRPWLAVAAAALVAGCGGAAPADRTADLVPGDAYVYLHVSIDPERDQDRELLGRLGKLPGLAPALTALKGARPWLGDEAAFAVTPRGTMAVLAVRDKGDAKRALPEARFYGRFAVVGEGGSGKSLSDVKSFAGADHEDDRVADLYAAPAAARLLPPALRFLGGTPVVADVLATDGGLRISARRTGATKAADYEPRLFGAVPRAAFAYASLRAFAAPGLPAVARPLIDSLDEAALSFAPGVGDPEVTFVARTRDAAAARRALAGLQGTIAAALTGSGETTGQVPVFQERDLGGGHDGYVLTLAGGGELAYAVADDRVAVSNTEAGVKRGLRDDEGIDHSEAFKDALPDRPDRVQALLFVASSQLLELADEAGLDAVATYRTLRPDLAAIRALGVIVRRQGNDTTVDLNLSFP